MDGREQPQQLSPASKRRGGCRCFSVEAEKQSQGVASALLEFALEDLPAQGFKRVQAAPLAGGQFETWGYRGPLSLYKKFGFNEGPMRDEQHVLVMREL